MKNYYLDNDYRLNYYCPNLQYPNTYHRGDDGTFLTVEDQHWYLLSKDENGKKEYIHDILRFIHASQLQTDYKNILIKLHPSDRVELFQTQPTFVKTRVITKNPKLSILLNLNTKRHFNFIKDVKRHDIPFHHKKNILLWRGSTTGYGFGNHIPYRPTSREELVLRYFYHPNQNIDVGFSELTQEALKNRKRYAPFTKSPKSIAESLQYKYILSVEGNDVASNLKWLLYSNSLIFMPKPFIESWIMESHLLPFVHYIPVENDFSDLELKIEWCNQNPDHCVRIVSNAREYIEMFLDEENEMKIVKKLFIKYITNVYFENMV